MRPIASPDLRRAPPNTAASTGVSTAKSSAYAVTSWPRHRDTHVEIGGECRQNSGHREFAESDRERRTGECDQRAHACHALGFKTGGFGIFRRNRTRNARA